MAVVSSITCRRYQYRRSTVAEDRAAGATEEVRVIGRLHTLLAARALGQRLVGVAREARQVDAEEYVASLHRHLEMSTHLLQWNLRLCGQAPREMQACTYVCTQPFRIHVYKFFVHVYLVEVLEDARGLLGVGMFVGMPDPREPLEVRVDILLSRILADLQKLACLLAAQERWHPKSHVAVKGVQ